MKCTLSATTRLKVKSAANHRPELQGRKSTVNRQHHVSSGAPMSLWMTIMRLLSYVISQHFPGFSTVVWGWENPSSIAGVCVCPTPTHPPQLPHVLAVCLLVCLRWPRPLSLIPPVCAALEEGRMSLATSGTAAPVAPQGTSGPLGHRVSDPHSLTQHKHKAEKHTKQNSEVPSLL